MSLLAYSVRRTVGALLVLFVVIWLIQFGVYHISEPPTYIGRGGVVTPWPDWLFPWFRLQPALANEWDTAALEVGAGVVVLLGLAGVWRLRLRSA
jgi:hypothetical protein